MPEPTIIINGHTLSEDEVLTVRVAVLNWLAMTQAIDARSDGEVTGGIRERLVRIVDYMREI